MSEPRYRDAIAPERQRSLEFEDMRLNLCEWGDPAAPPAVLCHGMFDHSRGFDRLAPLLAERLRVVAIDARGHGDSAWSDTYLWQTDLLDIVRVLRDLNQPSFLIGHSKGGGQVTDVATRVGPLARKIVNIDGFGPADEDSFRPPGFPDLSALSMAERCAQFLDRRRGAHDRVEWRPYASLDDLVERRALQNPLLERDWLQYFVYHGAVESRDGWRWKSDPQTTAGGFGPFKPQWIAPGWRRLEIPMLAMIGSIPDTWGPLPESILSERLAYVNKLERVTIEGAGHFVHMERPKQAAAAILDFFDL